MQRGSMKQICNFSSSVFWSYLLLFSGSISFTICESSEIASSNFSIMESSTEESISQLINEIQEDISFILRTTNGTQGAQVTKSNDSMYAQNAIPLPPGYNKLEIPISRRNGNITNRVYVVVSMFIRSILNIDEKEEAITLDTDFRVHWVDWKIYNYLAKLNFIDPVTKEKIVSRTVASHGLEEIWKPDIFIDEMDTIERTSIMEDLVTLQFLGDTGDATMGDIVYTSRNTLKLRCKMDFQYFPADTQICNFHIRSYSYNRTFLYLRWGKTQAGVYLNDPTDPNFSILIEGVKPGNNTKLHIFEGFDRFRKGRYSLLKFSIKIRRKLNYHLVQTYLPSVILILITWLCFLLPNSMVEARIGISMTTLLTLTAMFSSVRQQSPVVSYTMAIDVWMVFCIFCVFVALLLFTLIHWMKRHLKRSLEEKPMLPTGAVEENINKALRTYKMVVRFTKIYAFWALAFAFLTFFFVYWSWLLSSSGHYDWLPDPKFNANPLNKTTKLYKCSERIDYESEDLNVDDC